MDVFMDVFIKEGNLIMDVYCYVIIEMLCFCEKRYFKNEIKVF